MPIVTNKSRGKSAAIQQQQFNGVYQQQQQQPPQQSLLKIESVVPGLSRNPNKSIYRSYSTLSSGYFKRTQDGKIDFDQINRKTNGSSASTPQNNGFWRIQRSSKEKEKLPDRINLDRRGLTALPIIDDEPNLRLLSLQHNLINSFCVPDTQPPAAPQPTTNQSHSTQQKLTNDDRKQLQRQESSLLKPLSSTKKQKHFIQRSASTRNLFSSTNQVVAPNGATVQTTTPPTAATTPPSNMMKNSFIQKSVLLHAKEKYVFKKSSSFINNYSQHLAASKVHLGRLIQNRQSNKQLLSSFSSDSAQEIEVNVKPIPSANGATSTAAAPSTTTLDEFVIRNEQCFIGFSSDSLQNLVFLDLYDNQIEKVSTLDGLKSLTVLLLGKNRINDIAGIVSVKHTLRVLDLHGNKVTSISQKICQLQELKSLNLAGNSLKQIHADDFKGLFNLRELNLKRNKIKKIHGFDDLRHLERLWLCHNDLQKVEDMSSIAKAINLKEVTIENNPVSLGGDCVSFLVSYLPSLILLSQMQVTEQVRRAAMAWRKSKETSDANYSHLSNDVCQSIRREEVISNARTNWELLRSQQQVNKSSSYIQKTIKNTSKQLQVPVSEIEVDIYSNLSASTSNITDIPATNKASSTLSSQPDRKIHRQKTIANRFIHRPSHKKMLTSKRSASQDNLLVVTELPISSRRTADLASPAIPNGTAQPATADEYGFRLPPILAPFLDKNCILQQEQRQRNSSGSSLGPNIDSSSSCLSSDNEEGSTTQKSVHHNGRNKTPKKPIEKQETTAVPDDETNCIELTVQDQLPTLTEQKSTSPNLLPVRPTSTSSQKEQEPIELATTETVENDNSKQTNGEEDQTSNLSTNSSNASKNASELSMVTNCSDDTIASKSSSQKCRSANPNRKYQSPLIRAQTAKNINVPAQQCNGMINLKALKPAQNEREREQGGDYLIEICGRYLNVYGAGAIKFIDRQWNAQKATDVHTFKFSYVNFNSIATILNKIKLRFPNAENFVFRETNINSLGQLNALAEIQGICSLIIDPEGNLVCTKNWRLYAIYRLSHWGIKIINGIDVCEEEIEEAQKAYAGLSDLVLWSLPESLIEPLLARLRLDETCSASKMTAKQWLMQADPSLKCVVGKEALQCKKTTTNTGTVAVCMDESLLRQRGRTYFSVLMENTCNAVDKLQKLEQLWPNLLVEMIRNTLLDYAQIDVYVKNLVAEMMVKSTTTTGLPQPPPP